MTPGDRMEIEDYEPKKDPKNPRAYKRRTPLTRGNHLIKILSQGISYHTFLKKSKGKKETLEPMINSTNPHRIWFVSPVSQSPT